MTCWPMMSYARGALRYPLSSLCARVAPITSSAQRGGRTTPMCRLSVLGSNKRLPRSTGVSCEPEHALDARRRTRRRARLNQGPFDFVVDRLAARAGEEGAGKLAFRLSSEP